MFDVCLYEVLGDPYVGILDVKRSLVCECCVLVLVLIRILASLLFGLKREGYSEVACRIFWGCYTL